MNTEETNRKIQDLQILEQNLQGFAMQRQAFQIELNEIANALDEIKKTKDEIYKIVGNVMIKGDKDSVSKELEEKKRVLELRIGAIEKQEKLIESKTNELREEIDSNLSVKKKKE